MNSSIDAKRPWMSLIPNKAPHSTIAEGFVQGVLVRAWKKMVCKDYLLRGKLF